jgi:UDP-N-acetylglucosamine--N-acetylmuramyl-(pentapeptide) pyrophosphoryl-undecaprenol N-acetylglucosamine transferase
LTPARRGRTFAVIAGGGTAGHVLPGVAIGLALVARGHAPESIHFVGSDRGIERRLVPEAGFPLTVLPGRGIQRKLSARAIADNAVALYGLARAAGRAFTLVRNERPRVLVALGGYASVPAAVAAAVLRVPIVVAEQNAVPGAANRLVARAARRSAVSFPDTALPRAVFTGNPVRAEVRAIDRGRDRARARAKLGIDDGRLLVAVFGGSLGARRINDAVLGAAERWIDRGDLALRHVIGERDWDRYRDRADALAAPGGPARIQYQPVVYEDDMPTLYAAADIALCRSGATSVAELAAVGLPSSSPCRVPRVTTRAPTPATWSMPAPRCCCPTRNVTPGASTPRSAGSCGSPRCSPAWPRPLVRSRAPTRATTSPASSTRSPKEAADDRPRPVLGRSTGIWYG